MKKTLLLTSLISMTAILTSAEPEVITPPARAEVKDGYGIFVYTRLH